MTTKTLTYLAVPYSHADHTVKLYRFCQANKAAAKLIRQGEYVFSPISHTHPIAMAGDLPGNWEFWEAYDLAFLEMSKKMVVLMLDGWKESKGVQGEIAIANRLGVLVEYMSEEEIG